MQAGPGQKAVKDDSYAVYCTSQENQELNNREILRKGL